MASQINNDNVLNADRIKEKYTDLKEEYDYIIIDTPSGVNNGLYSSISGIDRAIIVSTQDLISIRNADKIKSILLKQRVFNISLILNRINVDVLKKKACLSKSEIDELLGLNVIAEIGEDINFTLSLHNGESLIGTNTKAGQSLLKISNLIVGKKLMDNVDTYDKKHPRKKGFLGNLFKK